MSAKIILLKTDAMTYLERYSGSNIYDHWQGWNGTSDTWIREKLGTLLLILRTPTLKRMTTAHNIKALSSKSCIPFQVSENEHRSTSQIPLSPVTRRRCSHRKKLFQQTEFKVVFSQADLWPPHKILEWKPSLQYQCATSRQYPGKHTWVWELAAGLPRPKSVATVLPQGPRFEAPLLCAHSPLQPGHVQKPYLANKAAPSVSE